MHVVRAFIADVYVMVTVVPLGRAPFTLQRLCELLMDPERHYKSLRKLTGAIDKVVNVSIHGSEVLRVSLAQDSASWGGDSAVSSSRIVFFFLLWMSPL